MKRMAQYIPLLMAFFLACHFSMQAFAADNDYYQMDDNAIYHFHQGEMWMSVGQYGAAIREFQIAIRLKPETAMTSSLYNDLGSAYLEAREFPRAIVSFQQAIKLNPNFSLYYENLVRAYGKEGEIQSAIAQLHQATQNNHNDVQAWYLLGLLYKANGYKTASRNAFQTFVQLAPSSELTDVAKLYLGKGEGSQTTLK